MTDNPSQDAGDPSDEQELDPSELSDEELRAYFTGGASEETPESTESETETQEVAEAGNTAEEPDDSVTEEEQEAERLAKMRVRPRDDVDQQILDLYKSEGFHGTLADATAVIKGTSEKPQPETTSETQEIDKAAELKAKIAELQDKAKSASEDLDTAQTFELQNQIMEHRLALMKVETDAERAVERQQAEADETYRQKAVESREKTFQRYPVLKETEGTERKLFDSFIQEKQNDPDYEAVFSSPKWVELLANEFATTRNLTEAAKTVSLDNLNRPPKTNTKVLTSATSTTTTSKPKITPQGVRDNMHRLDRDTLFSMLG